MAHRLIAELGRIGRGRSRKGQHLAVGLGRGCPGGVEVTPHTRADALLDILPAAASDEEQRRPAQDLRNQRPAHGATVGSGPRSRLSTNRYKPCPFSAKPPGRVSLGQRAASVYAPARAWVAEPLPPLRLTH